MPLPLPSDSTPTGILLTNLGTPDAPTPKALRRYLAEFLSDPDVVTLPRILWLPILYGPVLAFRPAKSAEAYARIWTKEGSPLLVNTLRLSASLTGTLRTRAHSTHTLEVGMRYGNPSLTAALARLRDSGARRLLVLPLYPQFARATTGSTESAVTRALARLDWNPHVRFVRSYHDQPAYIAALAESVREHWAHHGRGEKLLVSFHGIPKQVADSGDPYPIECTTTASRLAERLELAPSDWMTTFQSRFGPAEWLQPYTEPTLQELAKSGARTVDVICPGFAADCLETLEEIALRYAESFRAAGGQELRYIPALNARESHVRALTEIILVNLRELRDGSGAAGGGDAR